MSRRITLVVTLLCAVVLSGCKLDVAVEVQMANDGSGVVTVTAVADAELVDARPGLIQDLDFADATANGWEIDEPAVAVDGSATLVMRHSFADAAELANVLSSIGPPLTSPVGVARTSDGRQVTNAINAELALPNGYASFADSDLISAAGGVPFAADIEASGVAPAQGLSFTLDVAMPGRLVAAPTGTDTGTGTGTIRWVAPLDGQATVVEIRTVQQIGAGRSWWARPLSWISLGLLVAWIVFSVAFIGYVAYARRQRTRNRQNALRNLSETRSPVPSHRRRRR